MIRSHLIPLCRHRRGWLAAAPLALLTGCAATPNVGTDVLTAGMPNPEVALRESMRLVDAEMARLGTLAPALAPAQRLAGDPVVPDELNKTVTFAFAGPLDDGVRRLAETVGYQVRITPPPPPPPGQQPLPPLTVSVSTGFVPAIKAFNAIGEAAGSRALVRVDPQRHLVEVVYRA